MASIAQDKTGTMDFGYSVVNGTTVYPGIRYTGRLAADPPGSMGSGAARVSRAALSLSRRPDRLVSGA